MEIIFVLIGFAVAAWFMNGKSEKNDSARIANYLRSRAREHGPEASAALIRVAEEVARGAHADRKYAFYSSPFDYKDLGGDAFEVSIAGEKVGIVLKNGDEWVGYKPDNLSRAAVKRTSRSECASWLYEGTLSH